LGRIINVFILAIAMLLTSTLSLAQSGYALDFDGIDDYVNTNIDIDHTIYSQFTFEAWIYPTRGNHSGRQTIFTHDDCCHDRGLVIESSGLNFGKQRV
jgi:hypothetical protein